MSDTQMLQYIRVLTAKIDHLTKAIERVAEAVEQANKERANGR